MTPINLCTYVGLSIQTKMEGLLKLFMQFTCIMNSNVKFSIENGIISKIAAAMDISNCNSTSTVKNKNQSEW